MPAKILKNKSAAKSKVMGKSKPGLKSKSASQSKSTTTSTAGDGDETHDGPQPIFFWMTGRGRWGFLSQWAESPFSVARASISYLNPGFADPDQNTAAAGPNIAFSCAEQYMMYCKAILFRDEETAAQILDTPDPAIQKRLGRQVAGFDEKRWAAVRERIVEEATWAKFTAVGSDFRRGLLVGTRDAPLYEASPRDRIWGIGHNEKVAAAMYKKGNTGKWGLNLLGEALMSVRERLQQEDGDFHMRSEQVAEEGVGV